MFLPQYHLRATRNRSTSPTVRTARCGSPNREPTVSAGFRSAAHREYEYRRPTPIRPASPQATTTRSGSPSKRRLKIGRMAITGDVTAEYPLDNAMTPDWLAQGIDGNFYFTDTAKNKMAAVLFKGHQVAFYRNLDRGLRTDGADARPRSPDLLRRNVRQQSRASSATSTSEARWARRLRKRQVRSVTAPLPTMKRRLPTLTRCSQACGESTVASSTASDPLSRPKNRERRSARAAT